MNNALDFRPTAAPLAVGLLASIDARALEQPGKLAIHDARGLLSYDQLRRASNHLAWQLMARGLGAGDNVACCVERGRASLVALLGILKSGATLIPIDATHPGERLDYICAQNEVALIVTDEAQCQALGQQIALAKFDVLMLKLDAGAPSVADDDLSFDHAPEAIAYIIYTSGSTGLPKGVKIPHRALWQSVECGSKAIHMGREDICAQLAALTFDAAIWEHLAPLYCGATMICVPPSALAAPQAWAQFIAAHGITWTYLPPAFFAQWVAHLREEPERGAALNAARGLRCILFAGEALSATLVHQWQDLVGTGTTLMNFYGPTETTVLVCGHVIDYRLPPGAQSIPIGRPFGRNRLCLLNEAMQPCAIGSVGMLYIGGPQLAAGYVGDLAMTAKAFVPDPLDRHAVLYDSGDLAYQRPDGEFVFVGRRDRQVKLRGKRIELEEVERHLQRLPAVSGAAVFLDECDGNKRLVACLAAAPGSNTTLLRAQLQDLVPDYMVPSELVLWTELPLNANGKVDRAAVRDRYAAQTSTRQAGSSEPDQDGLKRIWQQVLGRSEIAPSDNFFALGGDSLLLFRALSLARKHGYDVSNAAPLLAANTLAGWQHHLRFVGPAALASVLGGAPHVYPLAPMQQEMFLLSRAYPGRNLYHIQFVFALEPSDSLLLERALRHVIACHPIARTVFREVDGVLCNVELPATVADQFALAVVTLPDQSGEAGLRAWMAQDHAISFDPAAFPLLRACHLRVGSRHHLAITFFHPLLDGWSFSLFVLQVCSAYAALAQGHPAPDSAPDVGFSHYVNLLARQQASEHAGIEAAYWRHELRLPLPLVALASAGHRGLRRAALSLETDRCLPVALKRLAANSGVTLHKVLLTAYFMLFQQLSGQRELLIGNTVMGRPVDLDDADKVLGCFISILPIRIDDAGQPFDVLLGKVATKMDQALAHSRIPNERHVHDLLGAQKSAGLHWRVIFALDNFPESFEVDQLRWPPYSWNAIEPFDIALSVIDLRGRLYAYWNYRSDLFDEQAVRAIGERYLALLSELCALAKAAP